MVTINDANRGTQLLMHAVSAAVAMAADGEVVVLDLSAIDERDHASRKAAVAAHLRATMCELEELIRSRTAAPAHVPTAVLGTRLIENGEFYDAGSRTYTPGPGFDTLLKALAAEADAAYAHATVPTTTDQNGTFDR